MHDMNVFCVFKTCAGIKEIQRTSNHDHWKHKKDFRALNGKNYRFCKNEARHDVEYSN